MFPTPIKQNDVRIDRIRHRHGQADVDVPVDFAARGLDPSHVVQQRGRGALGRGPGGHRCGFRQTRPATVAKLQPVYGITVKEIEQFA